MKEKQVQKIPAKYTVNPSLGKFAILEDPKGRAGLGSCSADLHRPPLDVATGSTHREKLVPEPHKVLIKTSLCLLLITLLSEGDPEMGRVPTFCHYLFLVPSKPLP